MPFPTVEGITFQEDLELVKKYIATGLEHAGVSEDASNELWGALDRVFLRIDVVSTQLYDDVQKLKDLENERATQPNGGFGADKHPLFPEHDPSQKPITEGPGVVAIDPGAFVQQSEALQAEPGVVVIRPSPPPGTSDFDPFAGPGKIGPSADDSGDTNV